MEAQIDQTIELYLASESPRRQELLQQLKVQFEVIQAPIDESVLATETPEAYVQRMAIEKAQAGFSKLDSETSSGKVSEQTWVIGGDTAVVLGGKIFGKPLDKADALSMLQALSGQTHLVLSSLAIINNKQVFSVLNTTQVTFKVLSPIEVNDYWQTGEPLGKAGGYAIQGLGARFIKTIHGSYSGVMGLPLYELDQLLTESGYRTALKGRLNA